MPRAGIGQVLYRTAAISYWAHQVTWRANSAYAGRQGNRAGERVHAAKAVRPHPPARSLPQAPGRDGGGFRCAGQASPRPPSRARDGTGLAELSWRPGLSWRAGPGSRPRPRVRGMVRAGRAARRAGAHRLTLARQFTDIRSTGRARYSGGTGRSSRAVGRSPGKRNPPGRRGVRGALRGGQGADPRGAADAAAVGLGEAARPVPAAPGPHDALVRNGGAGPGAVRSSEPVGYPGGRAGPGRGRRPAPA